MRELEKFYLKSRFQWRTEKWGVRIMEAKKYRRIFTIVVDSCGIGGAKDAERFGDAGTDTLGHIAETVGNLSIPNMQKLGIANLKELKNIAPVEKPMGYFTRLSEASNGKDTMTGHWEMMGLHITKPFLTFTEHGFPKDLIDELENMYIRDVLTGLYNRRGFENYARTLFLEAKVKESSVCVIGIDADGLKPVNDIFGHHEGDNVLRAIGYAINEAGRQGQIGARIGGDEFEVILRNVDEEDAKHWVYTFERSLETYNKKSGKPYEVHASTGYRVGIPGASDTLESFMKESDDIMYQNKIENKRRRNEPLR